MLARLQKAMLARLQKVMLAAALLEKKSQTFKIQSTASCRALASALVFSTRLGT